ncbi:hypothetical protein N9H59_01455 [Flavobacteriaceae bacterium]|nr:hypothetical protein [Flavobacteriaceae bacterium]MDA9029755.1 hypothetical protein [Flavobacteriaceae bacterium]
MSSIFEDKIEFDGVKYRTPKFKDGFEFIFQKINELEGLKEEKGNSFSDVSRLVHNVLQLSNLFLKDLEKLREFTETYKNHKLLTLS